MFTNILFAICAAIVAFAFLGPKAEEVCNNKGHCVVVWASEVPRLNSWGYR